MHVTAKEAGGKGSLKRSRKRQVTEILCLFLMSETYQS